MHREGAAARRSRVLVLSTACGAAAGIISALALLGWAADATVLKSVRPDFVAMKPNTALGLLLIVAAAALAAHGRTWRFATAGRYLCCGLVAALALATLTESLASVSFGVDTFLFSDHATAVPLHPGRIAPSTSLTLFGLALAVAISDRIPFASQLLGAAGALAGAAGTLGYAYGSTTLHQIGASAGVSLNGSIAVLLASVNVLTLRPGRGSLMLLTAEGAGSALLRRLLVTAVLVPPLVGLLVVDLSRRNHYDFNFAASLLVMALMVVIASVSLDSARRLQTTDVERSVAERELAELNEDLQRRVDERTASLRESEQRQLAVSRTARDGIVICNDLGIISFANPAAERLFGAGPGGLVDRSLTDLVPGLSFSEEVVETTALRRDGTDVPVEVAMASWFEKGRPWFAGTLRDLTARNEAATAMQDLLARYQRLADSGSEAVVTEQHGCIVEANRAFSTMFGFTLEEVIGEPLDRFVDLTEDSAVAAPSPNADVRSVIGMHRDGTRLVLELSATDIHIDGDHACTYTLQDVTAAFRRDQLRQARFLVAAVLAGDHPWNDASGRIARGLCQALGWGLGEIWTISDRTLVRTAVWVEDDELQAFAESARGRDYRLGRGLAGRAWSQGTPVWLPDVRLDARFDRAAAARLAGVNAGVAFPIVSRNEVLAVGVLYSRDHLGGDDELALVLTDLGRQIGDNLTQQRLEAELRSLLEHRASHDPLTGLPNRVLFQDRLQHALDLATRTRRKAGVLLLDLDRFKPVNDTFGHQVGDEVLVEVSRRLRGALRASDTVARIGGDEFGVLIEGESVDGVTLSQVSDKIARAVEERILTTAGSVSIGISIGSALVPDQAESPRDALAVADGAMYADKSRSAAGTVGGARFAPQD